jgi:hypothetical protein
VSQLSRGLRHFGCSDERHSVDATHVLASPAPSGEDSAIGTASRPEEVRGPDEEERKMAEKKITPKAPEAKSAATTDKAAARVSLRANKRMSKKTNKRMSKKVGNK